MTKNISITSIESKIYLLRGQKVMLDADLADLYQVPTHRLNEAVKRNLRRFPIDFMFQLTPAEDMRPMLLQNRACPCFRAFLKVKEQSI